MKIIFMGTPEFSVTVLEALVKAGHQVTLAVTQPDRQRGRGKEVQFPPVKEAAAALGIPVIQPVRIRDGQWTEVFRNCEADIGVVAAFGQILPKEILAAPRLGCVNVHASLLPKYRGAAPIQKAILDGEAVTGVTIMQMDEGLDTGDMIARAEVPVEPDETGGSLHDKLAEKGAALLLSALESIENHTAVFEKQKEEDSSYAGMLKKETGKIDWSKSAVQIERLIRGLNPWPSAYTTLHGRTLKLWRAGVLPDLSDRKERVAGQILEVGKKSFTVGTGDGRLEILNLQPEGKKRMDAEAFLRGYKVSPGEILGKE